MFRVYADKDGNPAEYSTDNVPLQPKHHFDLKLWKYTFVAFFDEEQKLYITAIWRIVNLPQPPNLIYLIHFINKFLMYYTFDVIAYFIDYFFET